MPNDSGAGGESARQIILAHGGGGELTRQLLAEHILPRLGNKLLDPLTDAATLDRPGGRICFTTDAYVVDPLEFPGGDIGNLAVCGTVNDLVVCGARPVALSLAMVIEEGLEIATLDRVLDSIASSAAAAGVVIATGDTKVIEHCRGGGLIITTAGVGELREGVNLSAGRIEAGDAILISGRIAEHGLAVMSARKHLAFETLLRSDVAALGDLVATIIDAGIDLKFMRDPTRGGLAGVLADLADETNLSIEIEESSIPISPAAQHTADMLGLDPLTVANEGKCVMVVSHQQADRVLEACRSCPLGAAGALIGRFTGVSPALVELITLSGGRRIVSRPYGEQLPRIC